MKAPGNRERPSVRGPEPQIRPPDINVCEPSIGRRDVDRRNPPDAEMPGRCRPICDLAEPRQHVSLNFNYKLR
jgi:hypothetical protein